MQIKKPGFYVLNHEQCKIPSKIFRNMEYIIVLWNYVPYT